MLENITNVKVTHVKPVYNYEHIAGGYFELYFGADDEDPFKLDFGPFLAHILQRDQALLDYVQKSGLDECLSQTIADLYEIGAPVDEWVVEYVEMIKEKVDPKLLQALFDFYSYVRKFGDPSGSLE